MGGFPKMNDIRNCPLNEKRFIGNCVDFNLETLSTCLSFQRKKIAGEISVDMKSDSQVDRSLRSLHWSTDSQFLGAVRQRFSEFICVGL
jgi:hypothetical protein